MANILAREQWTCSLMGGAEVASFGWYLFSAGAASLSAMAATVSGVTDPWAAWRLQMPNSTSVTSRELVEVDVNTGIVQGKVGLLMPATPAGNLGGGLLPPQIAEVVSIKTAVPGRRGRGRFFLPPVTSIQVDGTGRWAHANRDPLATAFSAYRTALLGAATPVNIGVYSRLGASFAGSTQISVGDVFDTQRSRRNKMIEGRIILP